MANHGVKKLLVVCPVSAQYQWKREVEYWADMPAIVFTGTPKKRRALLDQWVDGGALIIGYDLLKTTKNHTGVLSDVLKKKPDGVILDEAHRIKGRTTAVATAAFALSSIPYKLALTGTPAPNKPEEVWAILHWLEPKKYRSYWNFIDEYFYTYDMRNAQGYTFKNIGSFKPGKRIALQRALDDISIMHKRKDVMPWLPGKDRQDIVLPCTKEQSKYLHELEEFFETEDIMVQGILDRLIRYRQICLAPALLNLKGKSPKLEWLSAYVNDYPEVPTIVFSKFTSFIHLIADELKSNNKNFQMIIGETPAKARAKSIQDFQEGRCNLLLINIDAGKEALTLDRGECIIFTDQYPPAADIAQAEDRFVATTEARADKPHKIIRLMIEGTYDEQLYQLVEKRASATDVINNYKSYLKRGC